MSAFGRDGGEFALLRLYPDWLSLRTQEHIVVASSNHLKHSMLYSLFYHFFQRNLNLQNEHETINPLGNYLGDQERRRESLCKKGCLFLPVVQDHHVDVNDLSVRTMTGRDVFSFRTEEGDTEESF